MFNYFNDLFSGFLGVDNIIISTTMAQMFCVLLCICLVYLLSKLIFPKDSKVKTIVFCAIFIASILVVLYANGVNVINITQTLAQMGGV